MAPKTPKNPVADKPEGSLLAPQVPPAEPAAAATLKAAAQALAAENPPATTPPAKGVQDAAASQAAPGGDVTGAAVDPLPPLVAGTVRIRALRVIEHDGMRYGPEEHAGDELEVSEAQFHLLNPIQAVEVLQ